MTAQKNKIRIGLVFLRFVEGYHRIIKALNSDPHCARWCEVHDMGYYDEQDLQHKLQEDGVDAKLVTAPQQCVQPHVRNGGPPMVGMLLSLQALGCPSVLADPDDIARSLVRHLHDEEVEHWAYLGVAGFEHDGGLGDCLARRIEALGGRLASRTETPCPQFQHHPWFQDDRQTLEWIGDQPRPVGVICQSPVQAVKVRQLCLEAGLRIPGDVLLAAAYDEPMCLTDPPTITAVAQPLEDIAVAAAAIAAKLVNGGAQGLTPEPQLIGGAELCIRQSTGDVDLNRQAIERAVRYIQQHACSIESVEDLIEHTQYASRSKFFRLFSEYTGASPYVMMRQVRMNRAQHLLSETNLPIAQVAEQSGYHEPRHFSTAFRKEVGLSPAAYRKAQRAIL